METMGDAELRIELKRYVEEYEDLMKQDIGADLDGVMSRLKTVMDKIRTILKIFEDRE